MGRQIRPVIWQRFISKTRGSVPCAANMCIIHRTFGLRNMNRLGMCSVLMGDVTGAMYNPRSWPCVSHFKGLDLVIEYIEKYISLLSSDFTGKVHGSGSTVAVFTLPGQETVTYGKKVITSGLRAAKIKKQYSLFVLNGRVSS